MVCVENRGLSTLDCGRVSQSCSRASPVDGSNSWNIIYSSDNIELNGLYNTHNV